MRSTKVLLWSLMAFGLILASCTPAAVETEAPEEAPVVEEATEVMEEAEEVTEEEMPEEVAPVVLALGLSVPQLDPQKNGIAAVESILKNMFESLVEFDGDLVIQPALAESWERLDDLTLQFKLREDVNFHNGEHFDAHAAKASLERALDPETEGPMARQYALVESIDVVDDYTLNIVTSEPDPILLRRMTGLASNMMPPEYLATASDEQLASNPVGTGPYRFVSWERDGDLVMEANPDYWGGEPAIKEVIVRGIPETGTRIAALLAGEADIILAVPPDDVDRINASDNAHVESVSGNRIMYWLMEVATEPTSNKLFRQAVNYAANIDGIIETVLGGSGHRRATLLNPWHTCYNPDFDPYPYDPDKAMALLAEAGYGDGVDVSMHIVEGRVVKDKEVGEAIAGELAKVGINADIVIHEFGTYVDLASASELDGIIFASWGNLLHDADYALHGLFHSEDFVPLNFARGWKAEGLDELLDAGRVEVDETARCALYDQAQEIILEEAPGIFGYAIEDIFGISNRMNWDARSDEMIWFKDMTVN